MSLLKEYDPQLFILRNCIRAFGVQSKNYQECEHARHWLYKSLDLEDVEAARGWADGLRIALYAVEKQVTTTVQERAIIAKANVALAEIVDGLKN